MKFDVIEVSKKPAAVPASFVVFRFEGDNYIFCPVRQKAFKVSGKPEEIVPSVVALSSRSETYGYGFDQIGVEVPVTVGSTRGQRRKLISLSILTALKLCPGFSSRLKNLRGLTG